MCGKTLKYMLRLFYVKDRSVSRLQHVKVYGKAANKTLSWRAQFWRILPACIYYQDHLPDSLIDTTCLLFGSIHHEWRFLEIKFTDRAHHSWSTYGTYIPRGDEGTEIVMLFTKVVEMKNLAGQRGSNYLKVAYRFGLIPVLKLFSQSIIALLEFNVQNFSTIV